MKNDEQTGLLRAVPVLGSRWLRKIKILGYDSGFWQKILAGFELLIRFQIWQINSDPDLQY